MMTMMVIMTTTTMPFYIEDVTWLTYTAERCRRLCLSSQTSTSSDVHELTGEDFS